MAAAMLKRAIKGLAGAFGLSVVRSETLDGLLRATDAFHEQKALIGAAKTIFDVGAHYGQVASGYRALFPAATVYAFEPFPATFETLRENVATDAKIRPLPFGLSDTCGSQRFFSNRFDATNSLLDADPRAGRVWGEGVVESKACVACDFQRVDDFVAENAIDEIDILKLDVQGAETRVLDGARETLAAGRVRLIYAEVIVAPTYRGQKKVWEILEAFDRHGMRLHNIFNHVVKDGELLQFDAIFLRAK